MALPSLADILLVVVLLVPGFVAFILFKKIAMREKQPTDFEATVWSLSISLAIYALFGYVTGLNNIDLIRDNIFIPYYIALIFGFAFAFGGVSGGVARYFFRRGYQSGDCWNACLKSAANKGTYILIFTSDGKEYKGELRRAGASEAPKEIVINHPKMIVRDSDCDVREELQMGETMLFNETDIKRVVFLKEVS